MEGHQRQWPELIPEKVDAYTATSRKRQVQPPLRRVCMFRSRVRVAIRGLSFTCMRRQKTLGTSLRHILTTKS
jgi:hypothetical protein